MTRAIILVTLFCTTLSFATPSYRYRKGKGPHISAADKKLQMRDHGGAILWASSSVAVFWGQRWPDPAFQQDKISGVDQLLEGMNGSAYLHIANQYFRGHWASSVFHGNLVDTRPAPPDITFANSGAQAAQEVCRLTGKSPNPNTVYFVYTDQIADPRTDYCAYHDVGFCANGKAVHYAYFPSLDGVAGCDPGDTSGLHSQGMAALADSSAHELMETITDPNITTWYDDTSIRDEVGDACSYTFTNANQWGLIGLPNGTAWKIQTIWSNAAFRQGTGQASATVGDPHFGRPGCVQ